MQDAQAQSKLCAYAITRPGKEPMLFKNADKANTMLESLNDPAAKIEELKPGTWGFSSDEAIFELIARLTEWHESNVDQLQMIVNKRDADIELNGRVFSADHPMAAGIRVGILLALKQLGTLPFTVCSAEMEGDDE